MAIVCFCLAYPFFFQGKSHLSSLNVRKAPWTKYGMMSLANVVPNPCFFVDSKGIIRMMNVAAVKAFPTITLSSPLSFALRQPDIFTFLEEMSQKHKSTENRKRLHAHAPPCERVEWTVHHPGQQDQHVQAIITPLLLSSERDVVHPYDDDAFDTLFLVMLRDLTQHHQSDRLRADFITNASHELQTPLSALKGVIETLQGVAWDDPVARKRFLDIMHTQTLRMSRLIDDLLSLSRLEMNMNRPSVTAIDLNQLVQTVIGSLQTVSAESGCEIQFTPSRKEMMVEGVCDEITEVVENLLNNAIKYGASGQKILVRLSMEKTNHYASTAQEPVYPLWKTLETPEKSSEKEAFICLSVRDWGGGILQEDIPRLTERFYRGTHKNQLSPKGTGLGLAIVKHILKHHKACFEVGLPSRGGACFRVFFRNKT